MDLLPARKAELEQLRKKRNPAEHFHLDDTAAAISSSRPAGLPNDPDVLGTYAVALRKAGRVDDADAAYQRALTADPNHAANLGSYANFLTVVRGERDHDRRYVNQHRTSKNIPASGRPISAPAISPRTCE